MRADSNALDAVAAHVERRARALGRRTVRSDRHAESAWRDVARRLGLSLVAYDPSSLARALAREAERVRACVVVVLADSSEWDRAVAEALGDIAGDASFVLIASDVVDVDAGDRIEVESELTSSALGRWWDAVASSRSETTTITALGQWLDTACRSAEHADGALDDVPEATRALHTRLSLARRAWPVDRIELLGSAADLERLIRAGLAFARDGLVTTAPRVSSPDAREQVAVAAALADAFPGDAFASARSAELFAELGQLERAEDSMRSALASCDDGASRADLWRRWRSALDSAAPGDTGPIRLRGAELALTLGDSDVALAWANAAGAVEPRDHAALVLGRASLARGDLVSALAALERARSLATSEEARLSVAVEIGEVRYAMGEQEAAAALAEEVLGRTPPLPIRLAARNLQGKLLLARGQWSLADAHFAADECEAVGGAELTAELRARVNRAVALLSRGSSDAARVMLTQVLHDAESRGERRAIGFALSNLAVLAMERHDYGHALELLERTAEAHRRLGDRLNVARDIANLVELRLRLGLLDAAEQGLRFGQNALGPGAPGSRAAELALARAQVHLARGRTHEAERHVRAALAQARMSSDGDKLGECHRVAARIALEDGAVSQAEAELARARALAQSAYDHAELALLDAMVLRAAGRPALAAAEAAVTLGREAGDEELGREAHVLSAELALHEDDVAGARSHVARARALADEVIASISGVVRDAYLARPALLKLARLERLGGEAVEVEGEPLSLRRESEPPRAPRGETTYVGRHPSVRALIDSVTRVGKTNATVLIHGESGTGKELVSELIHTQSQRASGPLVKVNCAALVETLLLSELFGHEKGAFTGANARRRGRFERANGGTLFLDEIGDISPRTQVALLRVLEERRVERVGGTAPIDVDVRIVCATHRDLRAMVERGEFREDLYYRLSGITLEVPALRDRLTDLPLLCESILERVAQNRGEVPKRISREALELLGRHRWPGNVRELENALSAASVLSDGDVIEAHDFVEHVEAFRKLALEPLSRREPALSSRPTAAALEAPAPSEPVTGVAYREIRTGRVSLSDLKRNIERECIERALEDAGGNITKAATLLGMKRPRLSQLVKQYGFLVNGAEDPS